MAGERGRVDPSIGSSENKDGSCDTACLVRDRRMPGWLPVDGEVREGQERSGEAGKEEGLFHPAEGFGLLTLYFGIPSEILTWQGLEGRVVDIP